MYIRVGEIIYPLVAYVGTLWLIYSATEERSNKISTETIGPSTTDTENGDSTQV
jgi:hypothetical protein